MYADTLKLKMTNLVFVTVSRKNVFDRLAARLRTVLRAQEQAILCSTGWHSYAIVATFYQKAAGFLKRCVQNTI